MLDLDNDPRTQNRSSENSGLLECTPRADAYTEGPEDLGLFALNNKRFVLFIGADYVLAGNYSDPPSHGERPYCQEHGFHPFIAEVLSMSSDVLLRPAVGLEMHGMNWHETN